MTVYYKGEPLDFITLPESIQDLEEEIKGAADDRDHSRVNNIFLTLYKEGQVEYIEHILTRYFFSEKEINTVIERLYETARDMLEDPDYA